MEIKKEVHNNIKESYDRWNAWKGDFTFSLENADDFFLDKIEIEETIFKSTILGEDVFNDVLLVNELDNLLKDFPCRYLWAFGHKVEKTNKLRSYKGLTQGNFKIKKEAKFEIELRNGNSILGLCINLNNKNSFELEELFFGLPNSYIITSKKPNFKVNNFKGSMIKTLHLSGNSCYLDFYQTLLFWLSGINGHSINLFRLGGDGDTEMTIQKFYLKFK